MRRYAVLLLAVTVAAASAADWPQLLGPKRDSHSAETGLLDAFPEKGPEVAWEREVGEGYAGVVVAGGKAILFHRVGNEDVLEAVDAKTGKPAWKYATKTTYSDGFGKGNGPRATPTVAGGKVYTLAANGTLTCVSLKDGKKVWDKALLSAYEVPDSYFGVGTSPLVEGDLLLVNVGGSGAGVVAFNKDTGKEVWKTSDDGASYSSPIAATIDGVRMALFFTRNGLLSLDPATGKERFAFRWRARIDASVNAAAPVLLPGDRLFLSSSYNTGAIVLEVKKDGVTKVWSSDKVMSCHFNTPVAVGEQLYGVDGRQEGGAELRCVDWKTGKVRWKDEGFGCGSLIAAGKKLILMSEKGELILANVNAEKFDVLARAKVLSGTVRAHLALADGLAYCRDSRKAVCWKLKK